MAHTFDTSLYASTGTANPATFTYTCGNSATLLVLNIVVAGNTQRTAGRPSYGGKLMINVSTPQGTAGGNEAGVEMWYLSDPSAGAYTISVPNAGTLTLYLRGISFNAAYGFTSSFDTSIGNQQNAPPGSANPSLIISTSSSDAIVQILGSGNTAVPTGYTDLPFLPVDHGNYMSAGQYKLSGVVGNNTMTFTVTSDDWASVAGAWKETAKTIQIKSVEEVLQASISRISGSDFSQTHTISGINKFT